MKTKYIFLPLLLLGLVAGEAGAQRLTEIPTFGYLWNAGKFKRSLTLPDTLSTAEVGSVAFKNNTFYIKKTTGWRVGEGGNPFALTGDSIYNAAIFYALAPLGWVRDVTSPASQRRDTLGMPEATAAQDGYMTSLAFRDLREVYGWYVNNPLAGLLTTSQLNAALATKQNNLGFTPENVANRGVPGGYPYLDGSGLIPASMIPAGSGGGGGTPTSFSALTDVQLTAPVRNLSIAAWDSVAARWKNQQAAYMYTENLANNQTLRYDATDKRWENQNTAQLLPAAGLTVGDMIRYVGPHWETFTPTYLNQAAAEALFYTKAQSNSSFAPLNHNQDAATITSGVLSVLRGGTGISGTGTAGQLLRSTGSALEYFTPAYLTAEADGYGIATGGLAVTGTTTKTITITLRNGGTVSASFTDDGSGGSGAIPTLQQVLTAGNVATANLTANIVTSNASQYLFGTRSKFVDAGDGYIQVLTSVNNIHPMKMGALWVGSSYVGTPPASGIFSQGSIKSTSWSGTGTRLLMVAADGTASPFPLGVNGQVIKMVAGAFAWAADNEGSGSGTGDMSKSTYDQDNDGIVDNAEAVSITSQQIITGLGYTPYNAVTNPNGYISGNQIVTLGGDASGSGATAITVTLATVNTNVYGSNTFLKFAVDGKGRVTSATPVTSTDITTGLGYTPYNATNPNGYIGLSSVTWANLSGTAPNVSTFPNNAGYITTASLGNYELVANKVSSLSAPSPSTAYPNLQLLIDALAGKQNNLGFTPENAANKKTSGNLGTSTTLFPTEDVVKRYVDAAVSGSGGGVTINNNTNNSLLTASGLANTVNGESLLNYEGITRTFTLGSTINRGTFNLYGYLDLHDFTTGGVPGKSTVIQSNAMTLMSGQVNFGSSSQATVFSTADMSDGKDNTGYVVDYTIRMGSSVSVRSARVAFVNGVVYLDTSAPVLGNGGNANLASVTFVAAAGNASVMEMRIFSNEAGSITYTVRALGTPAG